MRIVNENGVNLERTKGNEEPKSKYYIIPEGDNTEIQYFCGIRDNAEELNIKQLIEIVLVENDEDEKGQRFGCNKKNIDFEKFKPNIKKAIKNERQFCEELDKLKNGLGSNVGKLLDSMIED